ncbi:beta-1,3-galactosyltransferase bre-2-like isoform X2 [Styela clava]
MATTFIRNGLIILISFSFCGIIYYLYETSVRERGRKPNFGIYVLNSSIDLNKVGNENTSISSSAETTITHPMTSFKQFGLEEISLLKRMDTQRPFFNILMEPWKMLCTNNTKNLTDSRWSMIVAVKTGYDRIVQRDRIRKTWPSNTFLNGVCLDVIFVVANTSTAEENLNLRKEESVHGDILQVELEETYRNIGLKALASMQWTADNFPNDVWITGFMRLRLCDLMTDREFTFNRTDINCGISTMAGGIVKHGVQLI